MESKPSTQTISFEDRYQIGEQLWLDGPHAGWLALDRLMQREVIMNIPYRPEDNERFISGVQSQARLRHQNLVPIYDFNFTSDDKPFFTIPYLKMISLKDFRDSTSESTFPQQVRFLQQICGALSFLHANNLLHLSLSPSHVLISQPQQEVYLQQNLQRQIAANDPTEELGTPGMISGVPFYMAPEQSNPFRLGELSVETDIFGLGGILYYILYGNPPNMGDYQDSVGHTDFINLLASRKGPPGKGKLRFTGRAHRKLAKRLEPICQRALHSDRSKRHCDASEFSQDLTNAFIG
jgi:serine/threonine protein kinase